MGLGPYAGHSPGVLSTTWGRVMRKSLPVACAVLLLSLGLGAGCSNLSKTEQRVLTGGAIGAAGGAVIAAIAGGSIVVGTLIGAGAGAALGAVTTLGD